MNTDFSRSNGRGKIANKSLVYKRTECQFVSYIKASRVSKERKRATKIYNNLSVSVYCIVFIRFGNDIIF